MPACGGWSSAASPSIWCATSGCSDARADVGDRGPDGDRGGHEAHWATRPRTPVPGVTTRPSAVGAGAPRVPVVTVLRRSDRDAASDRARGLTEADLAGGGRSSLAGEPTPQPLWRSLVARMRRGAMIVDVSIDAGGRAETSRRTTHAEPTFVEEGVIHHCVEQHARRGLRRGRRRRFPPRRFPGARASPPQGIGSRLRDNPSLRRRADSKGRVNHSRDRGARRGPPPLRFPTATSMIEDLARASTPLLPQTLMHPLRLPVAVVPGRGRSPRARPTSTVSARGRRRPRALRALLGRATGRRTR